MASLPQDLYDPLEQRAQDLPHPTELDYSIPGDLVMILPAGAYPAVLVRTPALREDWIPWPDPLNIETPSGVPTTLQYRGKFYGISKVRSRGTAVEYHLVPWPEGEIHRRVITYSRGAVLEQRSRDSAFRACLRTAKRLRLLYPLLGLLPSEIQLAIARRYPVNLAAAVRWSCAAETALSVYDLFAGAVLGALGSLVGSQNTPYVPQTLLGLPSMFWIAAAPLLIADACARWRMLSSQGRVLGNLLLEGVARLAPRD